MVILFSIFSFLIFLVIKDWKKIVTFFIIFFPFFGFFINILRPYIVTEIISIFYDFIFFLPIYIKLIRSKPSYGLLGMMENNMKFSYIFLILVVIMQFLNPFNDLSILAKLVGVKVWLFYFLFIAVGYYYLESENHLINICKKISYIAFIPCLIAIIQYLLSKILGYEETMNLFYSPEVAKNATQGFAEFSVSTFQIRRIPSTFSFITQFANYLIFIILPVMTAFHYSKTKKEKIIFKSLIILIFLTAAICGARGMWIYIPLFFIIYWVVQKKFYKVLILIATGITIISLINIFNFFNLRDYLNYIFYLFEHYSTNTHPNLFKFLIENFFGKGVGTATSQVINITGKSVFIESESFLFKIITELGFLGVISLTLVYMYNIKFFLKCINHKKQDSLNIFFSYLLAYYVLIITISLKGPLNHVFPADFLIFFFIGLSLKINMLRKN